MFVMRPRHVEAFRQATLSAFEDEMTAHCQSFSPSICQAVGLEPLRQVIHRGVQRAVDYGLTNRGPVRTFLELMFLFGSRFDDDPQYPWARTALQSSRDQMDRAERLFAKTLEYQQTVDGEDGSNERAARKAFLALLQEPPNTGVDIRREMTSVFPQKAAYIGEDALAAIAQRGGDAARQYGMSISPGESLMALLMFFFGHGCAEDPLYPWIRRILADGKLGDASSRVERLERGTMKWLERIMASPVEGMK